jgi:hypothetical protein
MVKRLVRKKTIKNKLLKGGDGKKVLVLCQRKTGLTSTGSLVEKTITPEINKHIYKLMGTNTTIIYLTKITTENPGTADYDCLLQRDSPCTTNFIAEHGNSFDLIILQTCPFIYIHYDVIHSLLKPDGYLGLMVVPNNWNKEPMNTTKQLIFDRIQSKNFVLHTDRPDTDIILFKKGMQSAGKNYNRKKSRRIKF